MGRGVVGSRLDSVNWRGQGDSLEHKGAMEWMARRDRIGRDRSGQTGSTRSRPGLDGRTRVAGDKPILWGPTGSSRPPER